MGKNKGVYNQNLSQVLDFSLFEDPKEDTPIYKLEPEILSKIVFV